MSPREILEEPFFYNGNNNYRLFGVLHFPYCNEKQKQKYGVVLCAPFAEEKLWSHRVFVDFARKLAKEGYTVLRFDYMGHGDSEGEFENSTVATRLSDIKSSLAVIRKKSNVRKIGLLGLRLGAALAAISSESISDIEFLILWEPVIKVEAYLQQCLRSNLATQMAIHKKILRNRKELTGDLNNGKPVNIDGYMFSGDFYQQAAGIDLVKYDINFSKPVQIIQIAKNRKSPLKKDIKELFELKYKDVNQLNELSKAVEEPFWSELKTYYQNAPDLFDKTCSWLNNVFQNSDA